MINQEDLAAGIYPACKESEFDPVQAIATL
jgi:hypothetical protein